MFSIMLHTPFRPHGVAEEVKYLKKWAKWRKTSEHGPVTIGDLIDAIKVCEMGAGLYLPENSDVEAFLRKLAKTLGVEVRPKAKPKRAYQTGRGKRKDLK